MKQEKAKRGLHCNFCGRDNLVMAVVSYSRRETLRICCDCAAAALRVLSSASFGERVNRLTPVPP